MRSKLGRDLIRALTGGKRQRYATEKVRLNSGGARYQLSHRLQFFCEVRGQVSVKVSLIRKESKVPTFCAASACQANWPEFRASRKARPTSKSGRARPALHHGVTTRESGVTGGGVWQRFTTVADLGVGM